MDTLNHTLGKVWTSGPQPLPSYLYKPKRKGFQRLLPNLTLPSQTGHKLLAYPLTLISSQYWEITNNAARSTSLVKDMARHGELYKYTLLGHIKWPTRRGATSKKRCTYQIASTWQSRSVRIKQARLPFCLVESNYPSLSVMEKVNAFSGCIQGLIY